VRPEQLVEAPPVVVQRHQRPGVGDGCLDLAPVAHDAGVTEQPLDVGFLEARHRRRVETGERSPEGVPLAQDRQP
jgi:hypothetical protein